MKVDLSSQTALITGGTRGLGLAIAQALGACGAQTIITHRWGNADEAALRQSFSALHAPPPWIAEADAGDEEEMKALLYAVASQGRSIDIFVSNVCVALPCHDPTDLRPRDLSRALAWSAWPVCSIAAQIKTLTGRAPRRIIATSSDGPEHYFPGYATVALVKSALETLVSQLATSGLAFALRTRHVPTQSLEMAFPGEPGALLSRLSCYGTSAAQVAQAAVAISAGLLDGLNGQIITVDRGVSLLDNALSLAPLLTRAQ